MTTNPLELPEDDIESLEIDEAVNIVENIIETLEEGDITLGEGKKLKEKGTELIEYIEDELDIEEGEIKHLSN